MLKKLPLLLFVIMVSVVTASVGQNTVDMADVMRSNGKIYVVVVVASIVMLGILTYLAILDKKISAMEKKVKEKNS